MIDRMIHTPWTASLERADYGYEVSAAQGGLEGPWSMMVTDPLAYEFSVSGDGSIAEVTGPLEARSDLQVSVTEAVSTTDPDARDRQVALMVETAVGLFSGTAEKVGA